MPRPVSLHRRFLVTLAFVTAAALLTPPSASAISSRVLYTASGTNTGDQLGVAAGAGDFDADGRPDVLYGIPADDAGGLNAGAARIVWGGRLSASPLVFIGQAGERLGFAAASAGDVNRDGWDDIILGAPFNDVGGVDAGRAYIYFGGPSADAVADVTLTGLQAGERFGSAVYRAGDMNGDGFGDVVVGAWLNDAVGIDAGRAYVFYGGTSPDATPDLTLDGAAAGDNFGLWVAPAEDLNADGYDDIVIGAWLNDTAGLDAGAAYVYFGGVIPDFTPDLTLLGAAAGDRFGAPAMPAGDMNGDGHPDLIVGAHQNDAAGANAGVVYLYYGGPGADAVADVTILGAAAGDVFGVTVATAGDVNADGYADVVVGANDAGPSDDGLVYVFLGGAAPDGTADLVLGPPTTGDDFGAYIETLGDVDGDGYADLVVGDITDDGAAANAGRVTVVAVFPYKLVLPAGGIWPCAAPVTVAWVGHEAVDIELSVDGGATFAPILREVGGAVENSVTLDAPELETKAAMVRIVAAGEVAVRANSVVSLPFGIVAYRPAISVSGQVSLELPAVQNNEVRAVESVDLNADGVADLVLGSPASLAGAGRAQVFLASGRTAQGKPRFVSPPITINPGTAGDAFGWAIATGDVNGDCVPDVAISAPQADPGLPNAGRVYVYFGSPTFDANADWIVQGNAANEQLGYAIAIVADMNGDAYDDLACGAPFSNVAGSGSGRVQIFFGATAPDPAGDVQINGEAAGDNFGTSLTPLPDGGGVDWCEIFPWMCPVLSGALLIGAPFNDVGAPDAGAAYVIAGGLGVNPEFDEVMRGTQANAHFGMTVASIGDFNGDGIGDFAIGAPDEDGLFPSPEPDMGRVRIRIFDPRCFVIDPWPEPGPDPWFAVFDGDAAGDRFGLALDGGDLNHDGLADLAVGAPNFDGPAGADAGRVYAYWGRVRPRAASGDIGPNHGVDPDFLVDGAAAGEKLGSVLALLDVVGIQPQPEPPHPGGAQPARLRSRCRRLASATASAHGPAEPTSVIPDFAPKPMLGCDLMAVGFNGVFRLVDINRYHLVAPQGSATWNVGSLQTVSWKGAEPAMVQLSVDGGATWSNVVASPGGKALNQVSLRVPHSPTRFGSLRIIPWPPCPPCPGCLTCPPFVGFAQSDTLLAIQSSVSLLSFTVETGESGAALAWSSEPGVGPEGIAGYRLYRVAAGDQGDGVRLGPELLLETRFLDRDARPGSTYRVTAINGLGEELELGRTELAALQAGVRAWPSPASSRDVVRVALAAPMVAGFPATDLDVGVFDVVGRRIATLAQGYVRPEVGVINLEWRPVQGRNAAVRPGLYFIRAIAPSAGYRHERKLVMVP